MRMSMLMATVALTALTMGGCWPQQQMVTSAPPQASAHAVPAPEEEPPPRSAMRSAGDEESQTAVEQAMVWAEKYTKAIEENSRLQEKVRAAEADKANSQKDMEKLKLELAQAQKELTDANAMLVEMKSDLDKWKKDVLGKHAENMKAHLAQLEALRKIMRALGNELAEPEISMPTTQATDSVSKTDQAE